ncbi:response regulator [Segetibacter sp.]|jgi:chemotaxis family two-component system response regulator Rcp1|uniref:response regulator n=1 Tax=Segetibacter sp. TaxID=2231182 RepID=UPI002628AA21|nr:response regulator [Segetibacter sp.]MCW3080442.1 two-component system response regulator [Segetibacter sp.]
MKDIHILLVEDNEGDIVLTKEALSDAKMKNKVSVAKDGEEAIRFVNAGLNEEGLLPDLILLDINLPKVDGKEVLHYLKNAPSLKRIPVVMLTTSSSELDVIDSYNNYANCFITKPVDFNKFFEVVRMIEDFWITIVKLPSKD